MTSRLRAGPILVGALVALAGTALRPPAPVHAQELADSVAVRTRLYDAELAAFEAAVRAQQAAQDQLGEAVNRVAVARRPPVDEDALEAARREAQLRAREVDLLDRRIEEVAERLDAARSQLLRALDAQLVRLQNQLLAATSPTQQDRINALVDNLQRTYQELQEEAEQEFRPVPAFYPAAAFDSRDGREEWEIKADLLERRAQTADAEIEAARETLGRLQDRLRLQRAQQDTRANRDRFGDALPPVGAPAGQIAQEDRIVADTTSVPFERLPLEGQIAWMEAFIASLEDFRDTIREQAEAFRRRLNRTSDGGGSR